MLAWGHRLSITPFIAPTYESRVPKSVVRVMTGRFKERESEEPRARYGKTEEHDYEGNRKSEELQFEATPGPERVVRCSKKAGALPLHLKQYDDHQQY